MANQHQDKKISLEIVNYTSLQAHDMNEIEKLLKICQTFGMFFLDLEGGSSEAAVYDDMSSVIAAQKKFFARGKASKMEFASDSPSRGYDMFEELSVQRLKMSRGQHLRGTLRLPTDLQSVSGEISSLFAFNDTVLRELSVVLCTEVSPPIDTEPIADPKNPGPSNMCLGVASAPVGAEIMDSHLDEDLLTVTYYEEPFLEVKARNGDDWSLVEVCGRMPIVNVGGELQKASGGRFYAPPHRCIQTPETINLVMYDLNKGVVNAAA